MTNRMTIRVYVPTWPRVVWGWVVFAAWVGVVARWVEQGDLRATVTASIGLGLVLAGASYDTVRAWQGWRRRRAINVLCPPCPACACVECNRSMEENDE